MLLLHIVAHNNYIIKKNQGVALSLKWAATL